MKLASELESDKPSKEKYSTLIAYITEKVLISNVFSARQLRNLFKQYGIDYFDLTPSLSLQQFQALHEKLEQIAAFFDSKPYRMNQNESWQNFLNRQSHFLDDLTKKCEKLQHDPDYFYFCAKYLKKINMHQRKTQNNIDWLSYGLIIFKAVAEFRRAFTPEQFKLIVKHLTQIEDSLNLIGLVPFIPEIDAVLFEKSKIRLLREYEASQNLSPKKLEIKYSGLPDLEISVPALQKINNLTDLFKHRQSPPSVVAKDSSRDKPSPPEQHVTSIPGTPS